MPTHEPTGLRPLRRVLLVDRAIVADTYAAALRVRGHHVETCHTFAAGLDRALSEERFDVAVLDADLDIPSGGFELARKLLSKRLVRKLIICTGTDDPFKAVMALRLGTYIPKGTPVTIQELVEAVEAAPEATP
jgi:DNA-binding response OmpR family regulator